MTSTPEAQAPRAPTSSTETETETETETDTATLSSSTTLPSSLASLLPSPTPPAGAEETINPLALSVRQIPGRGRGVFASRDIHAGVVLEDAPVLVLTAEQWEAGRMNDTILGEYGFCWSNGGMALGLGIASLFNHSSTPNVNFIRNTSRGTITFTTSKAVAAGEELCICYSADETKLWFMPTQGVKAALSEDEGDGSAALAKLALNDSDDEEERAARAEAEKRAAAKAERRRALEKNGTGNGNSRENGKSGEATVETRREQGGNTHSARERRKEKYRLKMEKAAAAAAAGVVVDDALPSASSTSSASTTVPTTASTPVPAIENLQTGVLAAAPIPRHRRPVVTAALPPAAHESSRHKHTGPVVLTDELAWEPAPSEDKEVPQSQWALLRRARGPVEFEEEEEADNSLTIPVWVVEVADPKLTRPVLDFLKDGGIESDARMRHLKRVRRTKDETGEHTYIALAMADEGEAEGEAESEGGITAEALASQLAAFNPALGQLTPFVAQVPKHTAKTPEQLKARMALWPVTFSPQTPKPMDARAFTPAKLAWVAAGIKRVLADAAAAKATGDLPVAVHCTSPPESLWPSDPTFIPPTPGLRASGHDTRNSEQHPLRHAAFNCIAQIARLRTVPPFSEIQSTRNGADYLLTSMSLFITHEPCVMCAMALVHSRVREVFFVYPRKRSGGFENSFGVHSTKDLNHRFDAWMWCGDVPPDPVPETVEI